MAKTKWRDVFFSNFRRYRRWAGGTWYHVLELPHVQGGFEIWTRTLLSDKSAYKLIGTERHG